MQNMTCQNCGAECTAGTNFCRQCGAPIASEQTTALLEQTDGITTQQLQSRATGPNRHTARADATGSSVTEKSRRPILIGAVVIAVVGLISVAVLLGMRNHNKASSDLMYPGAKILVDMTNERGGRALHLQTSDPFTTVEAWYQKTFKPAKTMRLTSTSVVLKGGTTTVTIAAEGNKTNILIKVAD